VLDEVARCAGAFDFQSTPWNQTLDDSKVGILVRETSAFTGIGEEFDYEAILAELDSKSISYLNAEAEGLLPGSGVKFSLVMGNEYGTKEEFSSEFRPGEVTHLSLSNAMKNRVMPEALNRVNRTNGRFQKTVSTVLKILHPLSFN
jgi:hypothetical protein